jgi:methionyl-tRNA formyltransferase
MRIVFMGTPEYGGVILKELLKKNWVVGVFTQPDKPVGRKKLLTPPIVKQIMFDYSGIPLFQPPTLKDKSVLVKLKSLNPDFIVVAAYGKLLPRDILSIAPSINLHASLLPKYRGASPIQEALLNGDDITGVTAMLMNERLDEGEILGYEVVEIESEDTSKELFKKLSIAARELAIDTLKSFNDLNPLKQNNTEATYCKMIRKADGMVDFCWSAQKIYNHYRAYYEWPKIFLKSGLKLTSIKIIKEDKRYSPGEILEFTSTGVIVGCGNGKIEIQKVWPSSKKEMDALSYAHGKRYKIGDTFC